MNIKTALLCTTLIGLGMGTALAADTAIHTDEAQSIDLREEIASSITGQILIETTMGVQQDFGGLSGNSTGMDGFPDATGDSSDFPQNNPDSSSSIGGSNGR